MTETKEIKLRRRREKEAYEARVDKKVCPECNVEQTYDEVRQRRNKCQDCGKPYRHKVSWNNVQETFMRRNSDRSLSGGK